MPYDLLIRNGTIVDGTGAPRQRADVAVAGGKIAALGKITDSAKKIIDAADLIVAPGFIDPHTHYDAQICWDPLVTCSSWHGVTTVLMGNCGVGLAPCKPAEREVATWNLVHVEAIPYDVLTRGLTWDWESFPQYLNAAARRGLLGRTSCPTATRASVSGSRLPNAPPTDSATGSPSSVAWSPRMSYSRKMWRGIIATPSSSGRRR